MFSYSQSGYLSEQHHLQLTGRKLFLALILKVQFCPFCSLVSVFAAKLGQTILLFFKPHLWYILCVNIRSTAEVIRWGLYWVKELKCKSILANNKPCCMCVTKGWGCTCKDRRPWCTEAWGLVGWWVGVCPWPQCRETRRLVNKLFHRGLTVMLTGMRNGSGWQLVAVFP